VRLVDSTVTGNNGYGDGRDVIGLEASRCSSTPRVVAAPPAIFGLRHLYQRLTPGF